MISSENAGKVTIEGKFLCVVCRKGIGSNPIPASFAGIGCIRDVLVLEVN